MYCFFLHWSYVKHWVVWTAEDLPSNINKALKISRQLAQDREQQWSRPRPGLDALSLVIKVNSLYRIFLIVWFSLNRSFYCKTLACAESISLWHLILFTSVEWPWLTTPLSTDPPFNPILVVTYPYSWATGSNSNESNQWREINGTVVTFLETNQPPGMEEPGGRMRLGPVTFVRGAYSPHFQILLKPFKQHNQYWVHC